eukprot:CAMPEP_0171097120 /NCGR_PEP_ID=MMETSP0766_2-20121228/47021_1 /TAXON_ID=439317 /ORGANISM="Gambierdiscus australes, Strain CAWD 149" /LENGTH=266 /DNA_ID=CAMNT_0011556263 /DNA_START=69 /DNA_END=869 /DNA_ORIENTATION=+
MELGRGARRQGFPFAPSLCLVLCAILLRDGGRHLEELRHSPLRPARRASGATSCAFARKHAYPTGKWKLLDAFRAEGSSRQGNTHASLQRAFEDELLKWGHRRQWAKVLALLEEMEENYVERDVAIYAAAIKGCGEKVKQWQRAIDLLGDLQVCRLEPSTEAFNWAVTACSKSREWKRGMEVLEAMRRAGMVWDEGTFEKALHLCRGGALWEEALFFLREMKENEFEPGEITYNKAMDACDAAGEMEWFEWVEDRAAEEGFEMLHR